MTRTLTITALALAASAVPAAACSIVAPIPGTAAGGDVVVAGTVQRVQGTTTGTAPLRVTLRVDSVLRGTAGSTLRVVTPPSSASCGVNFIRGHRYLVFASRRTETGPVPTGVLSTTLADATREIGRGTAVGQDDLYWAPGSGFQAAASTLTPRQLVAYDTHPVLWLGGFAPGGDLRAIRESGGAVTVMYGPVRRGIHITTRPACGVTVPAGRALRVRGVPAVAAANGLWVRTADVLVRVSGGSPATRLSVARGMFRTTRDHSWGTLGPLLPAVSCERG